MIDISLTTIVIFEKSLVALAVLVVVDVMLILEDITMNVIDIIH